MKKLIAILSVVLYTVSFSTDVEGYTVRFEETNELSYNPYTGEIKPFVEFYASTTIPYITETPNYAYGFDARPKECFEKDDPEYCNVKVGTKLIYPIVYISVKEGDKASFVAHNITNKDLYPGGYILMHDQKYTKGKDGLTLVNKSRTKHGKPTEDISYPIDVKTLSDGGMFTLCGAIEKKVKGKVVKDKEGNTIYTCSKDVLKIQVIPYDKKIKEFIYVQLDGEKSTTESDIYSDGWNPLKEDPENSFTEEKVVQNFNKVFKQALVEASSVTKGTKNEPFKVEDLISIDMTNPNDFWYKLLKEKAYQFRHLIEQKDDKSSAHWRVVFAINKERKKWTLKYCKKNKKDSDKNIDLRFCNGFNPEQEPSYTKYYIYSPNEECEKISKIKQKKTLVTIRKKTVIEDGIEMNHYYLFGEKNNNINYSSCNILYTDNGYPVVPNEDGVTGGAAAITYFNPEKLIEKNLPYESTVFAPRGKGESRQHTIVHEIAHSLGYTDIAKTGIKIEKETKKGVDFENEYATSETNLMTWQDPTGKKIRYRETPIACSGGVKIKYIIAPGKEYTIIKEQAFTGKGEKQWECIRDCYTEDFAKHPNRKKYWLAEGCTIIHNLENDVKEKELIELIYIYPLRTLKENTTYKLEDFLDYYSKDQLKEAGYSDDELAPYSYLWK